MNPIGYHTKSLYSISKYINIDLKILENLLENYNGICTQGTYKYCKFKKQQDIFDCIDQLNLLLKLSGELT
jgi:hypothetical protein